MKNSFSAVNATLLHFLQFVRHFSSRPLVRYVNSRGNTLVLECTYRLSPNLTPIKVYCDAPNYEEINNLFSYFYFGFKDTTAILRTINDANLIHDCLDSFLLYQPTFETTANPDCVFETASSALKSIFMQLKSICIFVYNKSHSERYIYFSLFALLVLDDCTFNYCTTVS